MNVHSVKFGLCFVGGTSTHAESQWESHSTGLICLGGALAPSAMVSQDAQQIVVNRIVAIGVVEVHKEPSTLLKSHLGDNIRFRALFSRRYAMYLDPVGVALGRDFADNIFLIGVLAVEYGIKIQVGFLIAIRLGLRFLHLPKKLRTKYRPFLFQRDFESRA